MKSVILSMAVVSMFIANQAQAADAKAAEALAQKSGCLACHAVEKKVLGPSYKDVAAKYKGDKGAEAKLAAKVKAGGSGVCMGRQVFSHESPGKMVSALLAIVHDGLEVEQAMELTGL